MDADREALQPVGRCFICHRELTVYVRSGEGGLDMTPICPIHGTRGVNPRFADASRSEAPAA